MADRGEVDFLARNKATLAKIARERRTLTANSYHGLRKILDARRVRLQMTMEELDHRSGLACGHAAKLLCGSRRFGPISLRKILRGLAAKIAILPAGVGSGNHYGVNKVCNGELDAYRLKARSRAGGLAKKRKMTGNEWREFSRKGALAKAAKIQKRKRVAEQLTLAREQKNGEGQPTSTNTER